MFALNVVRCICKQQRMEIEFMANLTAFHGVLSTHSQILMWLSCVCVCLQTNSNRRHKLLKRFINLFRPLYSHAYPSCFWCEANQRDEKNIILDGKKEYLSVCCRDMRERAHIIKQRKKLIIV